VQSKMEIRNSTPTTII